MKSKNHCSLYPLVALHALGWLCIANLAGLLLALMLLIPSVNDAIAPFTYGRIIPVHLNGQLYGWCFLPLIGILLTWYFGESKRTHLARLAVDLWSIALGVGCLYWLAGLTSGKLFMEWRGGARWLLSANMLFLSAALLWQLIKEPDPVRPRRVAKWAVWLFLLPVPVSMFLVADPSIFPSVNPDSGGATGGNLLVSSLGAITIMWLTPFLLRLDHRVKRLSTIIYIILQVLHYGLFSILDHGDQSNYLRSQIISLASLIIWVPLLVHHFKRFEWPTASRPWLWSFAFWGAFLVVSANIMFAPGLLDRWKFTNFLVGHTHAAMAGMLSSFNILILIAINRGSTVAQGLGRRGLFWAWNAGVLLHVAVLKIFGVMEGEHPDWLYYRPDITGWAYGLRLLSGVLMFFVGVLWLLQMLKAVSETQHD